MGRQDDTGRRRLRCQILSQFSKVLSLHFHCILVVWKWGWFRILIECAPAGACGRSAKGGSFQPWKRNVFAFPLAAPCSWNKIFCCECTSRLVDVLCLGHAPPWSFLLSKWATQVEDKQRIQFLGAKVTCQQYSCYRLYIWNIPYHAVHKQRNRHRQQHPQLLYHVCSAVSLEQLPRLKDNYSCWKTLHSRRTHTQLELWGSFLFHSIKQAALTLQRLLPAPEHWSSARGTAAHLPSWIRSSH